MLITPSVRLTGTSVAVEFALQHGLREESQRLQSNTQRSCGLELMCWVLSEAHSDWPEWVTHSGGRGTETTQQRVLYTTALELFTVESYTWIEMWIEMWLHF